MAHLAEGKLRVLMLGPLGPPHVSDQALALGDRGVDIHVGGNAPSELEDSVLQRAGIPVHLSPSGARGTPWGMAATVRWVRARIAQVAPDIVHAHWLPGFGFAAAAAGASPLALTAWGSDVYRASPVQRLANRYALRRADLVMADSQDLLHHCAPHRGRAELIQWGVDLARFRLAATAEERTALKRELGLGPGPVVLSPRSFMPVYNIPVIIEAFGIIGEQIPDAQLVLKHMGAASIELPELPHRERVQVIGSVPYERMADYYRAADVCVSITSSDSSPRSVWETMACGCPCVLSDLPWVRELIVPGRDALTVPVDAEAVAEAMRSILGDPALAASLSGHGRSLVEGHLDRDREMDRLADLYAALATA